MKQGTQQKLNSCPSTEDLSAFHDRALQDVDVEEHVADCSDCRTAVETFAVIDEAVQSLGVPPSDLEARIKTQCAALAPEPLLFRAIASPFWRYAAAAAAVVISAVAIHYAVTLSSPASSQVASTPPTTPAPVVAPLPPVGNVQAFPMPSEVVAGTPESRSEDRIISPTELTMANASGTMSPGAGSFAGTFRKTPVPPRVKHVWVVGDVSEASGLLRRSLPEGASCAMIADEERKVSLQLMLTDEQLQSLVDRLAAAGWPLLSPGVPQPSRGSELILSQNVVRYDVDLVISSSRN